MASISKYLIQNYMDILGQLFGSDTRVKLMRLFLFNPEKGSTIKEIIERSRAKSAQVRREIGLLIKLGIVKKRPITRDVVRGKGKNQKIKKVSDTGYFLDQKFPYLQALKNLLITASLHADDTLVKRFSSAGKIKLFIASGVFIQEWEARVDLLIVGDDINMSKLENIVRAIESEVGKEISYAAFETQEFEYRRGIHDRLIRDIFDFPHTALVDRLGADTEPVV
jgi:hypothetical protein